MGKSTFSGPLRTGLDTGNLDTGTIGSVILSQVTTIDRSSSVKSVLQIARVPDNSDIIDFIVTVVSAFDSGAAGVADIRIGTTADETRFGTVRVSGAGKYNLLSQAVRVSAGTGWDNLIGGNTRIYAFCTAVGSAMTAGLANIRTIYQQRA